MDFIIHVERIDQYFKGRKLLEAVNKIAASTELSSMTEEEIDAEIQAYRHGQ